MADKKGQVVRDAYSHMRISGLTVNPTPEDVELALYRLENMASELQARNICLNFNYEDDPDPDTPTGVDRVHRQMLGTNLALRLLPDFNKAPNQALINQANAALSTSSAYLSARNTREIQYPRRMARGQANSLRFNRWQRFYRPERLPPNECATKQMVVGDISDYVEDFTSYLGGETIASYVLTFSSGLNVPTHSNTETQVIYRVEAQDISTTGAYQQVKIVMTTNQGRVETRFINFELFPDRIRTVTP